MKTQKLLLPPHDGLLLDEPPHEGLLLGELLGALYDGLGLGLELES